MKRKSSYDHEPRARPSPFAQSTSRIRKGLAEIGEPGSSRDPVALSQLANELISSDSEAWTSILDMFKALIIEQPHKVPLLALILELVNQQRSAIAEAAVNFAHTELQAAINQNNASHIKAWLRFVCALTVAERPHIVDLLETLLNAGYFSIVVTAVVYLKYSRDPVDLGSLENNISDFCQSYTPEAVDLPVFGNDAPYTPKPEVEHYVTAAKASLENGWDISFMPPLEAFEPRGEVTPKATFQKLEIPETLKLDIPQIAYTRIYLPQGDLESVPSPDSLFGLIVRDITADIISNMDFSRKEVTRQLMTLDLFFNEKMFAPPSTPFDSLQALKDDGLATIKVEEIAVEAVLSQMMQLPASEFPPVYYHSILIEACIMFPAAAAPVLGRAIRFLFANSNFLDVDIYWRVVSWWAHHMSNFSFTWKWHEWIEFLNLPETHPKYIFMKQLVTKQVQLSYPSRVRDSLPAEFSSLVPEVPEQPYFKYEDDENVKVLLDGLEKSPAGVEDTLKKFKQNLTDKLIGQEASKLTQEYGSVVLMSMCKLGNRSITHAGHWVNRISPFIEGVIDGPLAVESVMDYWKQSPWVGMMVLDKLVESGAITGSNVTDYVFAHQSLLLSAAGYDRLKLYHESTVNGLELLKEDGEWDQWWSSRIKKVFQRPLVDPVSAPSTESTESPEPKEPKEPESAIPEPSSTVKTAEVATAEPEATTEPTVSEITAEPEAQPTADAESNV